MRTSKHFTRARLAVRLAICASAAIAAAVGAAEPAAIEPGHVEAGAGYVIGWNDVRQGIEGFGASNAFLDLPLTDAQADLFYSTSNGIGLSHLRMGIANGGGLNGGAWSDATKAAARGAKVWAVPWTAPGAWKDNNSAINGGHLCAVAGQGTCTQSRYADWATRLVAFAGALRQNAGVDLYALSVQNEPDHTATTYDSMLVSNAEFVDFVNVLGPQLAALNPRPKLAVGDFSNWNLLWGLAGAIEANPLTLAWVDIYATHQYWGVSSYLAGRPRPLWQTEMSSFEAFDPGIANGLQVAKWIHSALTAGNVSVWNYWWLYNPYNEDNEGLIGHPADRSAITKRLYTMGNFSKFVRPGWVRVDVAGGPVANLFVSAYRHPSSGEFAIVLVNDTGNPLAVTVGIPHRGVAAVTPWVTSAALNLQVQTPIAVVADQVNATLAYGVTTWVGRSDLVFASGFD